MWQMIDAGIPSLTADETAMLRAAPVAKGVVVGADDPQLSRGTAGEVAVSIGAPPPTVVPGRHLTMISSPAQLADAIRALCRRAIPATAPTR